MAAIQTCLLLPSKEALGQHSMFTDANCAMCSQALANTHKENTEEFSKI